MKREISGDAKTVRVLSIFQRLTQGVAINKMQEAERFGVSSKSIQRDLDDVKIFFSEQENYNNTLEYDRRRKGYLLKSNTMLGLLPEEVVSLSKILLESRSFIKAELNVLLDKIILQCSEDDREEIDDIIRNEFFHYTPPRHGKPLFSIVLAIARAVKHSKLLGLTYLRVGDKKPICYNVEPLGVIFSEFYFYLVAYISGKGYAYPAIYRLDRIVEYVLLDENFYIPRNNRFEEGEFRKKIQFMQTGELEHVVFRFWGKSPEAVLDRLPNAREIERSEAGIVYEAEVFGDGIKMWFLSLAEFIEVLKPEGVRQGMVETVRKLAEIYNE